MLSTRTSLNLRLPIPHDKQLAFIDSPAKRKVICSGRRGGKTTGASIIATTKFLEGRRVLYAAPTQEQTNAFWAKCKDYLQELIENKAAIKNETERFIEMGNGGRIRGKTAWDSDTLRGDYCDLLILEEYSLMDPSAWDEVGAPMLLDNDGDAVFIFTPKRRNHAFQLYQKAVSDDTGRYEAWHFTSYDNPFLSPEALAEITQDMTEEAIKQEILAEFLESEGQVFRNIAACMKAQATEPDKHKGHRVVAGIDWGKHQDYTAISVGCATCHQELAHDRFKGIEYEQQQGRLQTIVERWHTLGALPERNAIGDPIIEVLLRKGWPLLAGPDGEMGFNTTASTKPPLIDLMALMFERTAWQFIQDRIWTAEVEAYEYKVSGNTGHKSYNAPEGMHDDTVMARALMLWAAQRATALPDKQPAQPSKWLKAEDKTREDESRWKRY